MATSTVEGIAQGLGDAVEIQRTGVSDPDMPTEFQFPDDWGEPLEAIVDRIQREKPALPELLGVFQSILGRPGFYLRPVTLRQEIQMMEIQEQLIEERSVSKMTLRTAEIATCFTWISVPGNRLPLPNGRGVYCPEANITFVQANVDLILDHFNGKEMNELILKPMGHDLEKAAEEIAAEEIAAGGNAPGEPTG